MLLNKGQVTVFFGDAQSCDVDYKTSGIDYFQQFALKHDLEKLLLNKQIHGASGFLINSSELVKTFKNIVNEGECLVTNQKRVGVGVLTADCLPILFYDAKHHVAAAIHAGWKSSVLGICNAAFQMMHNNYNTCAHDLEVYFGPCAKVCCYQVQPDFLLNLQQFTFQEQVIQRRDQKIFFDNVLFNKLLIQDFGADPQKFNCDYNLCTICNRNFHSYRRDAQTKFRQVSFIALK